MKKTTKWREQVSGWPRPRVVSRALIGQAAASTFQAGRSSPFESRRDCEKLWSNQVIGTFRSRYLRMATIGSSCRLSSALNKCAGRTCHQIICRPSNRGCTHIISWGQDNGPGEFARETNANIQKKTPTTVIGAFDACQRQVPGLEGKSLVDRQPYCLVNVN